MLVRVGYKINVTIRCYQTGVTNVWGGVPTQSAFHMGPSWAPAGPVWAPFENAAWGGCRRCYHGNITMATLLWWCYHGGVTIVMLPWCCYHGGVTMVALTWWRYHGKITMVVFPWWCFHGGVTMVVLSWWCYHGGVIMAMLSWRSYHGGVTMAVLPCMVLLPRHSYHGGAGTPRFYTYKCEAQANRCGGYMNICNIVINAKLLKISNQSAMGEGVLFYLSSIYYS